MAPGDSLLSVVEKHEIDQIVVAVRDRRGDGFPVKQLLECKMKGVEIVELPTFFEREHRQVLLECLNPSWMVLGRGFRQGRFANAVKRLFDLIVSGALVGSRGAYRLRAPLLWAADSAAGHGSVRPRLASLRPTWTPRPHVARTPVAG